jgi:hypothetical protein
LEIRGKKLGELHISFSLADAVTVKENEMDAWQR